MGKFMFSISYTCQEWEEKLRLLLAAGKKVMFIYLFIYLFLAALGLCCFSPAFSNCGKWLLFAVAALVTELGIWGVQALVVVEHGLNPGL